MDEVRLERLAENIAIAILYERGNEIGAAVVDFVTGVEPEWEGISLLEGAISDFIAARFQLTARPGSRWDDLPYRLGTLMIDLARARRVFEEEARSTAILVAERVLRAESWSWKTGLLDEWRDAATDVDPSLAGNAKAYAELIVEYWMPITVPNDAAFQDVRAWGVETGLVPV